MSAAISISARRPWSGPASRRRSAVKPRRSANPDLPNFSPPLSPALRRAFCFLLFFGAAERAPVDLSPRWRRRHGFDDLAGEQHRAGGHAAWRAASGFERDRVACRPQRADVEIAGDRPLGELVVADHPERARGGRLALEHAQLLAPSGFHGG